MSRLALPASLSFRKRALLLATTALVATTAVVVASLLTSASTGEPPVVAIVVPDLPLDGPMEKPVTEAEVLDLPKVRHAAEALHRTGFEDVEPTVRKAVLTFIHMIGDAGWQQRLLAALPEEPDPKVRAWVAVTLGVLDVQEARAPLRALAKRRGAGDRALAAWYDLALLQLGDKRAGKRLYKAAKSRDIAVAVTAALHLAKASKAGDKRTIRRLKRLIKRERELQEFDRLAGLRILASLNRLDYAPARRTLYGHLTSDYPEVRLTTARLLAEQGDDRGKAQLFELYNDQTSSYRVPAAAALVSLGEYVGEDTLLTCVDDIQSPHRSLCNRALGLIGNMAHIRTLEDQYDAVDRVVGVAAAGAVLFILGLEPRVLRRESINWVRTALHSEEWTVRRDATSVAASLPDAVAFPLLAKAALSDEHPRVRRQATRALAGIKTEEAARTVVTALGVEVDAGVREAQVRALANMRQPVAADALANLAQGSDRLAALAQGAHIAVLDEQRDASLITAAIDGLKQRFASGKRVIRLAVMESARLADNRQVIPVLEGGLLDRVRAVRFAAAEGLAHYRWVTQTMANVLQTALKDGSAQAGRAHAALTTISRAPNPPVVPGGAPVVFKYQAEEAVEVLLEQPDPEVRQIAVTTIAQLEPSVARSLLPKVLADSDPQVRHTGVAAVEAFARREPQAARHMLKTVLRSGDASLRADAQAQLARLAPRAGQPEHDEVPEGAASAFDPEVLRRAHEQTRTLHERLEEQRGAVEKLAARLMAQTGRRARTSKEVDKLEARGDELRREQRQLTAVYSELTVAVLEVRRVSASGPTDDVAATLAQVNGWGERAGAQLQRIGEVTDKTLVELQSFVDRERDVHQSLCLNSAEMALWNGQLRAARKSLKCAEGKYARKSDYDPKLNFLLASYYDRVLQKGKGGKRKSKKRARHLRKAIEHYEAYLKSAEGDSLEEARARHTALLAAQ